MPEPLYTSANTQFAYQLRWSLALFNRVPLPHEASWFPTLSEQVEHDQVRLLSVHHRADDVVMFLVSTQPSVAPPRIVRAVKGRLQRLIDATHPDCFRRNFSLTSVGDPSRAQVLSYIRRQVEHHCDDDPLLALRLARFQLYFPSRDQLRPQFSSHGRYVYHLHLVLEFSPGERLWKEADWRAVRSLIYRASERHRDRIARGGILTDHLHLALSPHYARSPQEVALSYLNNVAYRFGMRPVLRPSAYLGSIGPYEMRAVRRAALGEAASDEGGN